MTPLPEGNSGRVSGQRGIISADSEPKGGVPMKRLLAALCCVVVPLAWVRDSMRKALPFLLGTYLLCPTAASAQAKPATLDLSQVKYIFIPLEPSPGREKSEYWSNPDNRDFQECLFRSFLRWKRAPKHDPKGRKWIAQGDCARGFPTVIPRITLVCQLGEADAMLLGYVAGNSKDVMSTTGTITSNPDANTADIEARTVTHRCSPR